MIILHEREREKDLLLGIGPYDYWVSPKIFRVNQQAGDPGEVMV